MFVEDGLDDGWVLLCDVLVSDLVVGIVVKVKLFFGDWFIVILLLEVFVLLDCGWVELVLLWLLENIVDYGFGSWLVIFCIFDEE